MRATSPLRKAGSSIAFLLAPWLTMSACAPEELDPDGGDPAGTLPDAGQAHDAGGHGDDDGGHTSADAGQPRDDGGTPSDDGGGPSDDGGGPSDDGGGPSDSGPVDVQEPPLTCAEPGFVASESGCVPDAPEPFRSRTEADVCARWEADFQGVFPEWEASDPADDCDPGVVPADALANALRRTNLYRWLAGVGPVVLDDALFAQQQACAVLQRAIGGLDHHPTPSAPCYTPEGAAGAGSSNLAFGAGLAGSVDLYVSDNGVPSLGHRRWVLNPRATTTQFGHKQNYSCMYSFSSDGSATPAFVSWPPPGFVPEDAARGAFSFASTTYRPTGDTVVEIAIDDGAYVEVEHTALSPGFGWGDTLRFSPPAALNAVWSAGTTLRVRVRDTTAGDVAWTTRFSACP